MSHTPGDAVPATDRPLRPSGRGWAVVRVIRSGILNVMAVLGAISILAFGASVLTGAQALNVISGSMEPGIPTGSLLLTAPVAAADIEVGDVITTERPNGRGLVTHRVVAIEDSELGGGAVSLTMRGDANSSDDPMPYEVREAARYVFHVPVLGFVSTMLKTKAGLFTGIAIAALLLFIYILPAGEGSRGASRAKDSGLDPDPDSDTDSRPSPVRDPHPVADRGAAGVGAGHGASVPPAPITEEPDPAPDPLRELFGDPDAETVPLPYLDEVPDPAPGPPRAPEAPR